MRGSVVDDDEQFEVAGSQTSELGSLYGKSRALPPACGALPRTPNCTLSVLRSFLG